MDSDGNQHYAKGNKGIEVILEEYGQISAMEGNPEGYLEYLVFWRQFLP